MPLTPFRHLDWNLGFQRVGNNSTENSVASKRILALSISQQHRQPLNAQTDAFVTNG